MSESACWCDDKSKEPCEGICRLMRDNERLGTTVGRVAMENAALRVAESHQLASARADLAALREAAQAVVDAHRLILEAVTPGHENELLTKMRRGDPEAWRGKEQYDARFSQWHAATRNLRAVLASADESAS